MNFTQHIATLKSAAGEHKWLFFFVILIILLLLTVIAHSCGLKFDFDGLVTEFHGFLLDILLFGVILYYYEQWQDKKRRIRSLVEQLDDFMQWKSEEGILRKLSII